MGKFKYPLKFFSVVLNQTIIQTCQANSAWVSHAGTQKDQETLFIKSVYGGDVTFRGPLCLIK